VRQLVRIGAVVFALVLVGAACGDDDDDSASSDTEDPASSDETGSDDEASDDTGSDDTDDDSGSDDTSSDDTEDDSGDDDSGGGFDRDEAIDELVDDGITRDQAECYVDGVIDEFGQDRIDELEGDDAAPTDDEFQALLDLATDCGIDLSELGGTGDDVTDDTGDVTDDTSSSGLLPGDTYGDNETLDALWDACEDGDDDACSDLYLQSEIGSEYEQFGATCGGRDEDFACAG
jgi:hypothetical protein